MKPDIIFLDLEGTLIRISPFVSRTDVPASMWTTLSIMLGDACFEEEEKSKLEWLANPQKNYMEWMDKSVRMFKRFGLNKTIYDRLINSVEIFDGVKAFGDRMRSNGCKIAIVTGALKGVGQNVQVLIGAQHLFAGCEPYFNEVGELIHWNLLPSDYVGKADFMRLLIKEYHADPTNCVFIGDGNNDVYLAKEVGLSIAFNAQEELKRVSTIVIDQPKGKENFLALADVINQYPEG